jgi:DNA polymerase-1
MLRLDEEISRRGHSAKLLLQVHDELVLEAPDEEVEAVRKLVGEVMEGAAQLRVRLVVHVGAAGDWLSAK